ncbi:MAG: molybdenum cofactor guanylyltransferase [Planctomycetota bacterium]
MTKPLAHAGRIPDKICMRLGGLILAGGRSRRMGRPKEALPIGDTTLLGWQCRSLTNCTDDVVVLARSTDQTLPRLPSSVHICFDADADEGPLMALASGLAFLQRHLGYSDDDAAMMTGCDQPFLTPELVRWLSEQLEGHDLVMPRSRDKLQPLTAVYSLRVAPAAEALLAEGHRRPRDLAARVRRPRIIEEPAMRRLDPELRCLSNLNHYEDYLRARKQLEQQP